MLTIGTVRSRFALPGSALNGGLYQYIAKNPKCVVDLLFEGQRAAAMNVVRLLLDGGSLIEIDEVAVPGAFALNDARASTLSELQRMGRSAARTRVREVTDRFFAVRAPP